MAAFALGLVGATTAVDPLLASLADPDGGVRGRAAEALGRIGDARAAPAIARLVVDALPKTINRMTVRGDDPGSAEDSWAEQRLALFALARLKDVPAARGALLDGDRPRFDWWAATWVAMRLESPELRPVLVDAVSSSDSRSRALAARGLGALKDRSAVELLQPLARDADETVALHALRALAAIGDGRSTATAAALLASSSDVVRREALRRPRRPPAGPVARPPPRGPRGGAGPVDPRRRAGCPRPDRPRELRPGAVRLGPRPRVVGARRARLGPRGDRRRDERGGPPRDAARRGPARPARRPRGAPAGARKGRPRHARPAPRARGPRRPRGGGGGDRRARGARGLPGASRRLAPRDRRRTGRARGADRRGQGASPRRRTTRRRRPSPRWRGKTPRAR